MTTLKLVNLMMRSSDKNPYAGKLSKKDNVLAAIELAKLAKNFSDAGQTDEAMNIESSQWVEVIGKLEGKLLNCATNQSTIQTTPDRVLLANTNLN